MLVGKYERDPQLRDSEQRRNEDQYLLIRHLRDVISGMDVVHHDREWREIEGDLVVQGSQGTNLDIAVRSSPDQIHVADISILRIENQSVSGVQSMIENPWEVVPMNDPEN